MEKEELAPVLDFCSSHQIEFSFISSLSEAGLIEVTVVHEQQYLRHDQLDSVEKLTRLHKDLDINVEGVEAIAHLLQRLHQVQTELVSVRQRLSLYE